MTTDRSRKRATRHRKATTGEPYVVARRRIGLPPKPQGEDQPVDEALPRHGPGSARHTQLGLVEEFSGRGWPLEVEGNPLYGEWVVYAGPARVGVGRESPGGGISDGEDPDDGDEFDLATPLQVHLSVPVNVLGGRPGDVDEILQPLSPSATVTEVAAVAASARAAAVAGATDNSACSICGDRYPDAHLLVPYDDHPGVCPACIFDGDLVDSPDVDYLTYQLDRLLFDELATPAGWLGVGALLAAMGPADFATQLETAWRAAGTFYVPMPVWDGAGAWWAWVGPGDGPLAQLAPGTSAAHLATTIAKAHPGHHREVKRRFLASTGQRLTADLWIAAVAYLVAFDTQARERPEHRPPWHALESFDATPERWGVDGWVVHSAVDCIRESLAGVLGLGWDVVGDFDAD